MSVEGPSRLPTRRTAERTAPAATAQARSVSRSPGTTGTAGVSVRAAGRGRATSAKRRYTDQPVRHLRQSADPTRHAGSGKRAEEFQRQQESRREPETTNGEDRD